MEMYPDGAVDRDPLQHGDVVGSSQGVAESLSLMKIFQYRNWSHWSMKGIMIAM